MIVISNTGLIPVELTDEPVNSMLYAGLNKELCREIIVLRKEEGSTVSVKVKCKTPTDKSKTTDVSCG